MRAGLAMLRLGIGLALAGVPATNAMARGAADDGALGYRFYAELLSGTSIVPDQDLALSLDGFSGELEGEGSLDPGFVFSGALGLRMNDYLRTEVNLSYRQSEIEELTSSFGTLGGEGTLGVFAAMANVYVDLLPNAPVVPFIGAGVGVGVVWVDSNDDADVLVVDDSSVELAWNLLTGANFPITKRFSLSIAYRYLATTDPALDATVPGLGSGTIEAEFDAHEVLFGARFGF